MNKVLSLIGISMLLLFSSCNSESNATNNSIEGQWKLVNVTGTFGGINDNFPPGTITWNFNSTTQMVTVVNNNTNPNLLDVLETGMYTYRFINNPDSPCGESLEIDGSVYGCYSVANDSLVIDQSIADGFAITLKR